ncbi:unnamed protein product [Clavelina lepadiformis]|uniref:Small ribosomal subunit protein mS29 n=1 Tax=Clavelina lepadiformis TaxID=159417 RepID=A0ABP0GL04_CLALP
MRNVRSMSDFTKHRYENVADLGHASYIENIRCDESDPTNHSMDDVSLMYTIPVEHYKRMSPAKWNNKAFSHRFQRMCSAFGESCLMIRKPGLELVNYLKHTNPEKAVNRYIIHGKTGCGKSMTLQYALHYCMSNNWLILPAYHFWDNVKFNYHTKLKRKGELTVSQFNKDRLDQPVYSLKWLETFGWLNQKLLGEIKTTTKYIWSKHESSEEGTSLSALVDLGKARPRHSTDVIGCIMKEIRLQDHTTMPSVLVAVDCINAAFGKTLMKYDGKPVTTDQLSFMCNFKKILSNDWKNGAVVGALDTLGLRQSETTDLVEGEHPYDLLGREGFDLLDPHILIHVQPYTDQEVLAQLAYYKDCKWLIDRSLTAAGEAEIIQLCGNNPADITNYCAGLY